MHVYVIMVLDSGLIVSSTSYEQEQAVITTRRSGLDEMLLRYYALDFSLPVWFCRMIYTGGPCVEGTAQKVILFKYFEWLYTLSDCGCE